MYIFWKKEKALFFVDSGIEKLKQKGNKYIK